MKKDLTYTQNGSAIFIILIAIALFAALSFVVGGMLRGGGADVGASEKRTMMIGEMLDYSRKMKLAIQQMRIANDCDDDEISFSQASGDAYEYSSPLDDSCKVFEIAGGNMSSFAIDSSLLVDSSGLSKTTGYGEMHFTGEADIDTVGSSCGGGGSSSCRDLLLLVPYLKKDVCDEINTKLSIDNYASIDIDGHDYADSDKFTGTYGSSTGASIGDGTSYLDGKTVGCFTETDHPSYTFFQVLIAR